MRDLPATRVTRHGIDQPENDPTTVYIAGQSLDENSDDARAGIGVWFGPNDARNLALRAPPNYQSAHAGAVWAILAAVGAINHSKRLDVRCRSASIIRALTLHLKDNESRGWEGIPDSVPLQAAVYAMRQHGARITFTWTGIRNQTHNRGSEGAKSQALIGAWRDQSNTVSLEIPERFRTRGAEIGAMTQSLAYRMILKRTKAPQRRTTLVNLDITRWAINSVISLTPTDTQIWNSLRCPDFSREIRTFLWKTIHGVHATGEIWEKISGREHLAACLHCEVIETMEHIQLECDIPAQKIVWRLAQQLWENKFPNIAWPRMKSGLIMGVALVKFKNSSGQTVAGADRLFRILVMESAWLIWKLRNERRIQNEDDPERWHSQQEIHNRWLSMINLRLKIDCLLTSSGKYGDKAMPAKTVAATWSGILKDEEGLSDDWIKDTSDHKTEVLVGIEPLRPNPRPRGRHR
ncbi:ribonuclease H-like protein [Armillaria solidipes]|uniref:Ribonuclease H-like protein n=1 Tax=Armillaria solidipes TaxID=1076256 RepID=A0A2H3AMD8_9AGAR|nr:ribonuclease H-like protein [Armillaria solidipes]